eukprot:3547932-Rhodomonas_salina.1
MRSTGIARCAGRLVAYGWRELKGKVREQVSVSVVAAGLTLPSPPEDDSEEDEEDERKKKGKGKKKRRGQGAEVRSEEESSLLRRVAATKVLRPSYLPTRPLCYLEYRNMLLLASDTGVPYGAMALGVMRGAETRCAETRCVC